MFYGTCGGASGLYALGEAVTGADQIGHLTGTIRMEAVTDEGDAVPVRPPRRNPPPVHPRNRSPPQVKWLQLWA